MEVKLKNGQKYKVKDITLDDRDVLLDSVKYEFNKDGSVRGVGMMHSTMTKWLRTCLVKGSDEFILGLTLDEKSEIFTALQSLFFEGEGKASK